MSIVAICPGASRTGLVYMDERRIVCCKTIAYKPVDKGDQRALMGRAEAIAKQVADWVADKPHECIVMAGFMSYKDTCQGVLAYQTPYLCGYLHAALSEEKVVVQALSDVFNPFAQGNVSDYRRAMEDGYEVWGDGRKLSNGCLRRAACHGIYYYRSPDAEGV